MAIINNKFPSKKELLAEGGVEELVASGRVPLFQKLASPKDTVFCLIPPPGTQFGDRIIRPKNDQGLITFESPDGKVKRGLVSLVDISINQADQLSLRINITIKDLKTRGIIK